MFPASLWAQDPPADCQGTETFQFEVQASLDGGATWTSNSVTLCMLPGNSVDFAVRTLMTVTAGETQGWSFSLKQSAIWSQYYGGGISVTGVTIEETDTETVQNGGLPDVNSLIIRPEGYTQGVLIDSDTGLTLPPVTGFVTSRACYHLTAPRYFGTYLTTLEFTHDLGNPPIRSVITQDGRSNLPCARNLNLYVMLGFCRPQSNPGCTLPGSVESTAMAAGRGATTGEEPLPADLQALMDFFRQWAGETVVGFRLGDAALGLAQLSLSGSALSYSTLLPRLPPLRETLGSLLRRGTRNFTG